MCINTYAHLLTCYSGITSGSRAKITLPLVEGIELRRCNSKGLEETEWGRSRIGGSEEGEQEKWLLKRWRFLKDLVRFWIKNLLFDFFRYSVLQKMGQGLMNV